MATLKSNAIYTTLAQNLDYVRSAHSTVPPDAVATVARYIEGDHANMLFAKAYDCSLNPELAAEQMLADRERYLHNKKSKHLSGQTEDKSEILAHHFYLSFHQCDDISIEEAVQINEEIFTRAGIIDNYRVLTAPHTNTDEQHVHSTVSSYHKDKQRKYCMNNRERYRLWAIADYVCVEHGLSIVENPKLLAYDAEYREWFSRIKAEGRVVIHPPLTAKEKAQKANERLRRKKAPVVTWTIEREIEREFYQNMRGRRQPVGLYSPTGRKRGILELSFILVGVAAFGMQVDMKQTRSENIARFKTDKKAQAIMDSISLARELGCNTPQQIEERLHICGQDMNSLRREIKYEKNCEVIAKHESRMQELRREYRNLKRLEATYSATRYVKIERNTPQTAEVEPERAKSSFSDLVVNAKNRTAQNEKYKAERDYGDR